MTPGDAGGPLAPQWWWSAVVVPVFLGARWLITLGRDGSQSTIQGQQTLINSMHAENRQQAERITALEKRIDEQDARAEQAEAAMRAEIDARRDEVHALRNHVARLIAQMQSCGITPVA